MTRGKRGRGRAAKTPTETPDAPEPKRTSRRTAAAKKEGIQLCTIMYMYVS